MKRCLIVSFSLLVLVGASFAGGQPDATASAQQPVQVSLWHGLTATDGQYMESLMHRYTTEKNPNIQLEASAFAWGDLYTKLRTAFLSKSLPTMTIMHVQNVPVYQDNAVQPIDDLVGSMNLENVLLPDFYEMTKIDGKTYYIPLTLVTNYVYFNKQDLIDSGYDPDDPPRTFEDLTEFARMNTYERDGTKHWGLQLDYGYGINFNLMLHSLGGRLLSEDGTRAAFNSPEGLRALNIFLDWWYESEVAPRQAVGSMDDMVRRFLNGGVSAFIFGTSRVGHLDSFGRENMSYQHYPSAAEGQRAYTNAAYHGVTLSRTGSREADMAALEITNWMLDPVINADFSAGSGQLPGTRAAYETDVWKQDGWWLDNAAVSRVTPIPYIVHIERDKIQEVLNQWFNQVRDRTITPQQGLTGAERDVNAILAGRR